MNPKIPIKPTSKPEPDYSVSAYPLKALNLEENKSETGYLHIITKPVPKKKYAEQAYVMPMADPYQKQVDESESTEKTDIKQPDHIEERDRDWFASYE